MLSRVAERLYWMGRYIERAENTARLLNVFNMLMLDLPRGAGLSWSHLVGIAGGEEDFRSRYRSANERNTLMFMLADRDNPGSIITSVSMARENLRTTRDTVPAEGFESINELQIFVRRRISVRRSRSHYYEFLSQIVQRCQGITGLLAGTMSHDAAYQFVRIGRNLERADMTTRILDVASTMLVAPDAERERLEHRVWTWLLSALSAHQAYRQTVRRQVTGAVAAGYLLHDTLFPRALLHTVGEIRACVKQLPRNGTATRTVRQVEKMVRDSDMHEIFPDSFHDFIDELQVALGGIHERIQRTWFEPVTRRQAM